MRVVFFGTPDFAVPSLRTLLEARFPVVAVVTQPDRPRGRSHSVLVAPPVKRLAEEAGIPVLQPERPAGDLFLAALRRLEPEIGVVAAYGHILRPDLLALPPRGMLNVHASLLPRWRGAAPIQYAILRGDDETGISIMRMEAGLDSGPVLHRTPTAIEPDETGGALTDRLARLGAVAITDALQRLIDGSNIAARQDDTRATYAPKIDRQAARLDWRKPAADLARQVRAFDPVPGAWTLLGGEPVKLFGARVSSGTAAEDERAAGRVLRAGTRLLIACGSGALLVREVQPAGRTRISAEAWLHGRDPSAAVVFQ
ncbi:MAG: methionyl-tRNA formyltransferase [Gemmatimonadales bacterium]|nr:methionyl-tRNA formyltransferase [Gemmatimonadales bacterium]